MRSGLLGVFALPGYPLYFVAALLAAIGTGMYFVAVSWYLFQSSGSTMAIGWAFVATTLPGLVLSPLLGSWLDRFNSKWMCVLADAARAAILLTLALGMLSGNLLPWHIYLAGFFVALCDNTFQPAIAAIIRDLVPKDDLLKANVVGSMASQAGTLLGASVGGFAVAFMGTGWVVVLNAGCFACSALLIVWIRHRRRASTPVAQTATPAGVWQQFRHAIESTPQRGLVFTMALQQVLAYVTVFVCNTLLPGFVVRELQAGAEAFGIIDAGWGVGALAGGVVLGRYLQRAAPARLGASCLLILAAGLVMLALSHNAWQATAAYALLGGLGVMLRVNGDTEIVKTVDPAHFGKIKSGIVMLTSWASLAVYLTVGFIGDAVSSRYIYAFMAATCVSVGLLMLSRAPRPLLRSKLS